MQKNDANTTHKEKQIQDLIYDLSNGSGKTMMVYKDRCIISVKTTVTTVLTGNVFNGKKTIYYKDCIGVQFKECSTVIAGYIQLETASSIMNNQKSNFYNENTFEFYSSVISNELMREVADYINGRVSETKEQLPPTQTSIYSAAELKNFKDLLDDGIITQEEFDMLKKKLLEL